MIRQLTWHNRSSLLVVRQVVFRPEIGVPLLLLACCAAGAMAYLKKSPPEQLKRPLPGQQAPPAAGTGTPATPVATATGQPAVQMNPVAVPNP